MANRFQLVDKANVKGKRVLVRVDFNVPLEASKVADDTRIRESLPTIEHLRKAKARLILMSHLGRPKGRPDPRLSLKPVATRLGEILKTKVAFAADCVGPDADRAASALRDGEVLLLENVRFHPEEEANDPQFAGALAALAEIFVSDAFGSAHRAHASVVGVAEHLPAYAGFLMAKELEALGGLLNHPKRPFVAVLGGAKVSDKIAILKNLIGKADAILVGGAMAFTFSRAQGGRTGDSLVEEDAIEMAREIIGAAREAGARLLLPTDVAVARETKGNGPTRVMTFGEIEKGWKGLDIGPKTAHAFGEEIARAATVFFNGPMGVFEQPAFRAGTKAVLEAMAESDATTVLGGGDSASAAAVCGVTGQMDHVSTGGGASLQLLGGKRLPGVAALAPRQRAPVR